MSTTINIDKFVGVGFRGAVAPVSTYDPDAQAFITATGISGGDATTLNELVLDLKGANIWTKFNALYPIIGTTATQHKFNLKNPLDTNAAFRLSFVGGWTHSSTGATPNGTNAYADSFFNQNTVGQNVNSTHLSYYSRTNSSGNYWEIGAVNLSPDRFYTIGFNYAGITYYSNNQSVFPTTTGQIPIGLFLTSRTTSTSTKLYKNGAILATDTNLPSSAINLNVWVGARNSNLVGGRVYSNRQCAFASIGSGLTDVESQLFYQIVEKYQVALGRSINPLQSFYYNRNYNNETNAYLFSTQITNTTEQTALDTFVTSLKGYGIWSKMKAVYPIMGTTATQQKFNLVNPQDTNSAYRITFAGGWVHSATGMQGNGSNTTANPNLIPSSVLTTNNTHISYYIGTDTAAGNKIEMGVGVGGTLVPIMLLSAKYTGNLSYSCAYNLSTNQITAANADARGFYVGSRTTSTSHKLYKDGSVLATDTNANPNTLPTQGMIIGALNSNGSIVQYSDRQYRFISIGDGLNDTEVSNFRTAVQTLQTALGRQV
jgi:hypothetical protein